MELARPYVAAFASRFLLMLQYRAAAFAGFLTVPVKLPSEVNQPYKTKPENINLAVGKEGKMFWNEREVPDTNALLEKLKTIAVMEPQPELHIRGDQETRYEYIGKVIFTAQRAGIAKVAFITEPPARGG